MNFIDTVRFSYDMSPGDSDGENAGAGNPAAKELLYSAVIVKEDTFPRLWSLIGKTFENLGEKMEGHAFFVAASNELQALCLRGAGAASFLFSSALVERFDDAELMFVIGHEIGHQYFRHGRAPVTIDAKSVLRCNILSRSAEISADRAGLLGTRDLNAAISALIKTVTGLDSRNVRFQVNAFLRQYNDLLKHGPSHHEALSSHPMFLLRLRALILFSHSREYAQQQGLTGYNLRTLGEIDNLLHHDLQRLSGISLADIESDIIRDAILLGAFLVFANDGKITKDEQNFVHEYIGTNDFSRVMDMLHEGGIDRLAYEFESTLEYISNGSFADADRRRMREVFQRITDTFPDNDTHRLRQILNARNL